jgi:hypothetical protein
MKKIIILLLMLTLFSCREIKNVEITLLVGNKEVILNKTINPYNIRVVQEGNVFRVEYWGNNNYETIVFYKEPTRIIKIKY